jgi:hypothetical protein
MLGPLEVLLMAGPPLPPSASACLVCRDGYSISGVGLLSVISLATMLKSMREKFRSKFILDGGGGVLATLSGYVASFPHFVTARRICFP